MPFTLTEYLYHSIILSLSSKYLLFLSLIITVATNSTIKNVLLLNASLSVIQSKPGSMMLLWQEFTKYIINELNNCEHSIIFVAWGAFAHKKLMNININKHKLIVSSHPSPLSIYKNYKEYPCFNDSKPFSKSNKYLIENNNEPINW